MKIGSLVELVRPIPPHHKCKVAVKNVVYTVRAIGKDIGRDGIDGLLLEEIVNPINPNFGKEYCFKVSSFRELQPPIANIEEHINQNTLEYEERV